MKKLGTPSNLPRTNVISAPAYPFSGRVLLRELRHHLLQELREPMTFDKLGRMIGRRRSTTHRWFDGSSQSHLIAFLCLLERLSPDRRRAYINAHCRPFPTLESQRLAHSPITTGRLLALLDLPAGMTLIGGGNESSRTFLIGALAHASQHRSGKLRSVAGIDLHRPDNFVPVPGINYIDGTMGAKRSSEIVAAILPKVLASSASLLLFNDVWSLLPKWRSDILRCANHRNVILADVGVPNPVEVKKVVQTPINILSLSSTQIVPEGIRVNWRRIRTRKSQQSRTF